MFMPRVSYNRGIFDCFSSGICLGLYVTEADRCLCLGLKSTEAISLLRVKKKSRYCSSSLREQQQFFLSSISERQFRCRMLLFLRWSFVAARKGSFIAPSPVCHHTGFHHYRRRRASKVTIVVVQSRFWYVLLLFLIMKPFYVLNVRFGSRWFSRWRFNVFRFDMVVKGGCFASPVR